MRKLFTFMLLFTLYLVSVSAQESAWQFPLAANLVQDKGGFLLCVNRQQLLEEDHVPHDLVKLKLHSVSGDVELRKEAAQALGDMFAAAELVGHKLYVKSAYRSYQTQSTMYYGRLEKTSSDDGVVAYPGSSDHQTGLGVDILNYAWTLKDGMTPAFGNTAEAKWMEVSCADFGFILRYMPEKQDITGIIYEPWHFRYVGKEVARYIMGQRLSLEEFDQQVLDAIAAYEQAGGDYQALVKQLEALPPPKSLAETDAEGDGEVSLFYKKEP